MLVDIETVIRLLLTAPVMHVDDTSICVNRKKHWIHACSAGDLVIRHCHPKHAGQNAFRNFCSEPAMQ
ncbi:MAG: hypothetical protein OXF20_16150 [Gammaproteobacteria bacterium]|nr:hypothetical protein [Gammaproteobacteria bacterium]